MEKIFSQSNFVIYLIIINIITFTAMWLDKRKAQKNKRRIPEKTLFILVMLGGGIGGIAGMYTFRHKTQKTRFVIGFPLILIIEIITYILIKYIL